MNERAFRCSPIFILIFALLLALPGLAAADETPRLTPQARAAFQAVAPPQAAGCRLCALVHQQCSVGCFGLAEKGGMGECLRACDNAAANCTCDEVVSLRSEDLVNFEWPSLAKAACHPITTCDPAIYGSCASWSGYSDCDDPFCGVGAGCGENCEEFGPCIGPAMKQRRERFRVCFDSGGNPCTEWQRTQYTLGCGC